MGWNEYEQLCCPYCGQLAHAEPCFAEIFPVDGQAVTCGLRLDLPRSQRRHIWMSLGADIQNKGTEGFCEVEVQACTRCGKDKR